MRNQFFDPGFLFKYYSDRGSMATPSGRSNVSWCGLRIFSGRNGVLQKRRVEVFEVFSKFDHPWSIVVGA